MYLTETYAEMYVAQIDIPARAYTETVIDVPAPAAEDQDGEDSASSGGMGRELQRLTSYRQNLP